MNGKKDPVLLDYLVSCYFWASLFLISALLFPVSLILFLLTFRFDKRRKLLHKFTCRWADIVLSVNPYWRVCVEGREKIDPEKVYVMVSNHQSGVDILLLFKLHTHFKWVAKRSLFDVPFIGWNMWLNGYIPIVRSKGRSKLTMMNRAESSIGEGNSLMLFPEGTRTRDGKILPFKTGAFRLALKTGSPILPVVIKGAFEAISKGSLRIRKNHGLILKVLDPVPFEAIAGSEPKTVTLEIQEKIRNELEKI